MVVDFFAEEDHLGGDSTEKPSLEDREYLAWADLKAIVVNGDLLGLKSAALSWSTEDDDLLATFEVARNGGEGRGGKGAAR